MKLFKILIFIFLLLFGCEDSKQNEFTQAERELIKSDNNSINIGYINANESVFSTTEYKTNSVDYLSLLSRVTGLKFNRFAYDKKKTMFRDMKNQKIDILCSTGSKSLLYNVPKNLIVNEKEEYILIRLKKDRELKLDEQLDGEVGIVNDSSVVESIKKKYHRFGIVTLKNYDEAFKLLFNGALMGIIMSNSQVEVMTIISQHASLLTKERTGVTRNYRFMIREDQELLASIFKKGNALLESGSYNYSSIIEKNTDQCPCFLSSGFRIILQISVLILFLISIFSFFNIIKYKLSDEIIPNRKIMILYKSKLIIPLFIIIFAMLLMILNYSFQLDDGKKSISFNDVEFKIIKASASKMNIYTYPHIPPFDFFNNSGERNGLFVDTFDIIKDGLGVDYNIKNFNCWSRAIKEFREDPDGILIDNIPNSDNGDVVFSKSIFLMNQAIVTLHSNKRLNTIDKVKSYPVAILENSSVSKIFKEKYNFNNIIGTSSSMKALRKVLDKEAVAAIVDLPRINFWINNNMASGLVVSGTTDVKRNIRIALKKENIKLLELINRVIDETTQSEKNRLFSKWNDFRLKNTSGKSFDFYFISVVFIILISLLFTVYLWNRALKKIVNSTREQLSENQRRLSLLIENLPGIIYSCKDNNSWTMDYMSDGVEELTGYRSDEIVNNRVISYSDLIHPDDRIEVQENVRKCLRKRIAFECRYRLIKKDKSEIWVYERGNGVFIDGSVSSIEGIISDVTDDVVRQHKLRHSQKMEMIGTMSGGLAHDFNNILGGINGSVSVIKELLKNEDLILREKIEKFINTALNAGERAGLLIEQLMKISRKIEPKLAEIDLNEVLRDVIEICRHSIPKEVEIKLITPPNPVKILAQASDLEQVFLNICINAGHAMTIMRAAEAKSGGLLRIKLGHVLADRKFCFGHDKAEPGNTYWKVSISDTGVGMHREEISRIFEPFYSGKKDAGTGLGLSMAYGIVDKHGGFIDVLSRLEYGSEFTVYIPEQYIKEISLESEEEISLSEKFEGAVLIIDDEPIILDIASEMLKNFGLEVFTASDGLSGYDLYRNNMYNIKFVILDMSMPGMSGVETQVELMKLNPDVKIIICSGLDVDEMNVRQVLNNGANCFLRKPFTPKDMYETVKRVLEE